MGTVIYQISLREVIYNNTKGKADLSQEKVAVPPLEANRLNC